MKKQQRKQLPHRKYVPQRTCVACRRKLEKRQLTRIVRSVGDGVVIDISGKRNGRGAYLCDESACWDKALNSGLLDRALLTELSEDEKVRLIAARPSS